jgi:uncharacterized protein (DUF1697 family)
MGTFVALLRGINVGPRKRIRMEPLRDLVRGVGFADVRTLVNSGNVVFTGEGEPRTIAQRIEEALREGHALEVDVVVRTAAEMAAVVNANPFPEIAATPKLLHVSFLAVPLPEQTSRMLDGLDTGDDRFVVCDREVYVHAPHGLSGASPGIQSLDRKLSVVSTSRNWNTVTRLAEMAGS